MNQLTFENQLAKRIHRKRTKGWTVPPGSVYVGRGSKWGNPFRVVEGVLLAESPDLKWVRVNDDPRRLWGPKDEHSFLCALFSGWVHSRLPDAVADLVRPCAFGLEDIRSELSGKNLMCWCAIDLPCHADVLLSLANAAHDGRRGVTP